MNQKLENTINELRQKHPYNVPAKVAAKALGKYPRYIHMGLQTGRLPFGTAVHCEKEWSYNIPTERFISYLIGRDVNINQTA